eukprot:INCI16565.1.p1 GENE.INCI16565.1~~INCI16565.1.p1  ORF type:complete len:763 (+),score=134.48 INCI16565.1:117-2405(+)
MGNAESRAARREQRESRRRENSARRRQSRSRQQPQQQQQQQFYCRCPGCQQTVRPPENHDRFTCPSCRYIIQIPKPCLVRCPTCTHVLQAPAGALSFQCPCGTLLRLPRSEEFWQCSMCFNLNQKKVHCTMCGSAKASDESDAALGQLEGTVAQKHNQRRALAARNMKRQWERYETDGFLRWRNLLMKWDTNLSVDAKLAESFGIKKLKRLIECLDCASFGGQSANTQCCVTKQDLVDELLRAIEALRDEKPSVLLALLKRLNMDHNICVEKKDIIQCILWATVFYESNTGWVRYLNQQLASDGRGIGNQAPIPREQVAPAGGGGGGGAARAAGHVGLMDDDDSASLTFVPAASWMLDLRQVPSDVVNQLLKMKNLPFRSKVHWFRLHVAEHVRAPWEQGYIRVKIRRSQILSDAFREFERFSQSDLLKPFVYEFIGEPGIDAGGVAREFFQVLSNEIFNLDFGLFRYSNANQICYSFNPSSGANELHLEYFKFVGRIFGKALLEQHTISGHFTVPIYKHMLAYPIDLPDLDFVDTEIARNLRTVLEIDPEEVEHLGLDFTITEESFGEVRMVRLKPDGDSIEVDGSNRREYVQLMLKHLVLSNARDQLCSFLTGFYEVIPEYLLTAFDFQELELLLGGLPVIDVEDWKNNTLYSGKLHAEHCVVKWFWEVVDSMSQVHKARLLQFATGTATVPVIGFAGLVSNKGTISRFTLKGVTRSQSPYPIAHTCFNRIDLPAYTDKAELEMYLISTIEAPVTGFGLQ